MKTYEITLKHDKGRVKVQVLAAGPGDAQEHACRAEGAPLSAVVAWKLVVPDKTAALVAGLEAAKVRFSALALDAHAGENTIRACASKGAQEIRELLASFKS